MNKKKKNAIQNPWRRGPAPASTIPISAMSSLPLRPRGPAIGFFTPPNYSTNRGLGTTQVIDPPLSAMYGQLQKGVHFE